MPLVLITSTEWNALVSTVENTYATVQRIDRMLTANVAMERQMAQTLDDVLTDISELGTKEDGLVTLLNGIKAQLTDALSGTLTPDQQAKVDQVFAAVEARKAAIQEAIDANTPPSPPVEPAP